MKAQVFHINMSKSDFTYTREVKEIQAKSEAQNVDRSESLESSS